MEQKGFRDPFERELAMYAMQNGRAATKKAPPGESIQQRALRKAAADRQLPYVHREGREVALVVQANVDRGKGTVSGQVHVARFSSAGEARDVAARVLADWKQVQDASAEEIIQISTTQNKMWRD
jgi:hypothetical protein